MNAPSLNTGFEKRFVVAIGTFMPVSSSARRKRFRISSRSAGRRAGRHEVVVVEADAVRADVGEVVHRVDRVERRPRLVAERVAAAVADGPQAEGEVVVGSGWYAPFGSLLIGAMFVPTVDDRATRDVPDGLPTEPPTDPPTSRRRASEPPPGAAGARVPPPRVPRAPAPTRGRSHPRPRGSSARSPTTSSSSGPRSAGRSSRAASTGSTSRTSWCAARATTTSAASRCSTPRPRSRGRRPRRSGIGRRAAAALRIASRPSSPCCNGSRASSATRSCGRSSRSSRRRSSTIIMFILLDGDLFTHDRAEGAIEHELSVIYTRLGAPVAATRSVAAEGQAQLRRAHRGDAR